MLMKEELLTNISSYLNNFTKARTDSLKNAFETVHGSIQMSVNDILYVLLEINLYTYEYFLLLCLTYLIPIDLYKEANITTIDGMLTSIKKNLERNIQAYN